MVDFAREVLAFEPTPRQAAILDEIERDRIRTAVLRLGRRSGKGRIGAIVATFEATANAAAHLGAVADGEQVAIVVIGRSQAQARLVHRFVDGFLRAPALAPLIEREILWRLLTGPHADVVRQIGLADSGLSHITRAIGWIRDNYAEPMRVADLARLAGMSASVFHRRFRAVTTMSPLQFQKRIRLQEARALLVARPDDVAGVGHLVGYDSPSQFNREYLRLFGVPPGQDAARLRASGLP